MKHPLRLIPGLLAALLLGTLPIAPLTATASPTAVYLGDRQDLFLGRDSLDGLGMNTAHSGEPIKIGSAAFDKGIGFHCQPDRDAYVEFDVSTLGMTYFAASVGVLKEASYFLEWGSISFHVYGDGELLASSPTRLWGDEPYFLTCDITGVKTLRLVQNNEGGHSCDAGVWGDARVTSEKPTDPSAGAPESFDPNKTAKPQPADLVAGDYAYISDLYWLGNATYPGNAVGRDCNTANEIIFSTDGSFFPKGVGLHAVSGAYDAFVDVNIDGLGYTKFTSFYGICETLTSHDISMASVKFAVFGDGEKLWESDPMSFGKAMERMECDISGVRTLRLCVAGAPGIAGAWGTWGGALLSKSGNVTDDLLRSDLAFEEEPPAETEPPAGTEPVTEPVTEPDTAAPTVADTPPTTDPATTPDTDPPAEVGCTSALAGSTLAAIGAVAVLCRKRKED